jgi:hypothetical protein
VGEWVVKSVLLLSLLWIFPIYLTSIIGTGISLYGRTGPGGGMLNLVFDGEATTVNLNSTDPSNSSTRLWHLDGMVDGDHSVIGYTSAAADQTVANVWVDYFE